MAAKLLYSVPLVIDKPLTASKDSYYDFLFNGNSPLGAAGTLLNGWCIQREVTLQYNNGYSYTANAYDANDFAAANSFAGVGSINWLLNYYHSGTSGYSADDVQMAIWQMLGQGEGSATTALTQLALTHADYVPDVGETLAVVIDPTSGTKHDQNLIVETKAAKLGDHVWQDKQCKRQSRMLARQALPARPVQLVRDINSDGKISANEILATHHHRCQRQTTASRA